MNRKTHQIVIEALNGRQMMSATAAPAAESAVVVSLNNAAARTAAATYGLDATQKHRVEQITSTFENSTTELQYKFFSDINDGRGYTAGRAGFTTGTGDLCEVVRRYTQAAPGNVLAKYLPRLEQLSQDFAANNYETPVSSTTGLEGMKADWATACNDPKFIAAQDSLVDDWYYTPAMEKAQQLGLNSVLAKGQIWDALIQHGNGSDYDGLNAMIARTPGKTPANGGDENTWIKAFMQVRRTTLSHATNEDTREAWAESVSRVDAYITFATQGNYALTGKLDWTVYGDKFSLAAETTTTPTTTTPTTPTTPATPTTPVNTKGSISGQVFIDHNEDGKKNGDDYGNEWRVVFIDTDNDMYRDENEAFTYTDAKGNYRFDDVAVGTYNVRLESVDWTWSTTDMNRSVRVAAGQDVNSVNFGEIWA